MSRSKADNLAYIKSSDLRRCFTREVAIWRRKQEQCLLSSSSSILRRFPTIKQVLEGVLNTAYDVYSTYCLPLGQQARLLHFHPLPPDRQRHDVQSRLCGKTIVDGATSFSKRRHTGMTSGYSAGLSRISEPKATLPVRYTRI